MVVALIYDRMRPGMILFSVVILFFCAGILTPKEVLEGFSKQRHDYGGSFVSGQ